MAHVGESFRALVVDDDPGVRYSVGSVIESCGHQVVYAGSGDEACEAARAVRVHFSVLDVNVRAESGLQILAELRSLISGLPAIVITGHPTPDVVRRARDLGAHGILPKPLEAGALRRTVQELVRRELAGQEPSWETDWERRRPRRPGP